MFGFFDFVGQLIFSPIKEEKVYYDDKILNSGKKRNNKSKRGKKKNKQQYNPQTSSQNSTLWQETKKYDSKALKLTKDCLKNIKLDNAELAVDKLIKQSKNKSQRDLARIIILKKAFHLAKVGLDTNAQGNKARTIAQDILKGMEGVNLRHIIKFSAEMIYQISLIYGQSSRSLTWKSEVLTIFGATLLGEKAIQANIDWLQEGFDTDIVITNEAKALMLFTLGEAACLFYEVKCKETLDPFKNKNHFDKMACKSQNLLDKHTNSMVVQLIAEEIEKSDPIDYSKLENLLESNSWQEADQETCNILIKLMSREDKKICETILTLVNVMKAPDSIAKIDYCHFYKINSLWQKYSDNHFGFIVQKEIYESASENMDEFSKLVGWQGENGFKLYEELTFSLDAPKGHLPAFWLDLREVWENENYQIQDWLKQVFSMNL